jgi:hypothetical protein
MAKAGTYLSGLEPVPFTVRMLAASLDVPSNAHDRHGRIGHKDAPSQISLLSKPIAHLGAGTNAAFVSSKANNGGDLYRLIMRFLHSLSTKRSAKMRIFRDAGLVRERTSPPAGLWLRLRRTPAEACPWTTSGVTRCKSRRSDRPSEPASGRTCHSLRGAGVMPNRDLRTTRAPPAWPRRYR